MNDLSSQNTGETLDYYRVLNIERSASAKEIREAYFRLKNTYDPDNQALYSLASSSYIQQALEEVEKAFSTLCDAGRRRRYDLGLSTNGSSAQTLSASADAKAVSTPSQSPGEDLQGFKVRYKASSAVRHVVHPQAIENEAKSKIARILGADQNIDGPLLKRIREEVGVSKMTMQEHTKISLAYLDHLEENRFEMLPQPVYVKGFLKSYLSFLGVTDSDSLVESYMGKYRDWMRKNNR